MPGTHREAKARSRRRARRLLRRLLVVLAILGGGTGIAAVRVARIPPLELTVHSERGAEWVELVRGSTDLAHLARSLADREHRDVLVPGGDAWLLTRTLVVGPGAALHVERTTLRLASDPGTLVGLEARGGRVQVSEALVTSWDRRIGAPDEDVSDGRAWVLAGDGASLDVLGARMQQLGYDRPDRHGVSWRGRGTGGEVRRATFSANFDGVSTEAVAPMRIRDSVIERSLRAGLEAAGGPGLLVERNQLRDNAGHGAQLGAGSGGAIVRANVAERNGGSGIAVLDGADDVVVQGNEVDDNHQAGIDLGGSARTSVVGNVVYANATGVSVHDGASQVTLEGNRVTANRFDGVLVSSGATVAAMRANVLDFNYRAGAFLAGGTVSLGPGNQLVDNDVGLWIAGAVQGSTVLGNTIGDNVLDGVHLEGRPGPAGVANRIRGNSISGNGRAAFSVEIAGTSSGLLTQNAVAAGNGEVERLREG